MTVNITPLHDRVLVRRLEEKETAKGGIIIPDTAKEKPQEGEVMAIGAGKTEKGHRVPLDVKVGQAIAAVWADRTKHFPVRSSLPSVGMAPMRTQVIEGRGDDRRSCGSLSVSLGKKSEF
jgi:co-chaperonin GroES (HSP10)